MNTITLIRNFLLLTLVGGGSLLFTACSEEVKQEDIALQAAKVYYEQLLQGDYNAFVEGSIQGDSLPAAYKSQLLLNAQMYIEQQNENHKGIKAIEPLRATCDTTHVTIANKDSMILTANAFLAITYADSTREEIVVPMINKNSIWYLK